MKRLLVTGQHGFVGTTLTRMVRADAAFADWRIVDVPETLDLRDAVTTSEIVAGAAPDAVLHLAAQSWVPDAQRDPAATLQVNLFGTLNLLQALKQCGFRGRMIYAGTGDVYGVVPEDALPVAETRLAAPRNPYAVSKLAAEALCYQWTVTEAMDIVLARPFNHIGGGQSERFVVSDFARQITEIRQGGRKPVVAVGDIDVTRDFTDVRDVIHAYFALLASGSSGEVYNVCSGHETSIRVVLERLATLSGVEIAIEQDPARLRKAEQRRMCGNPAKLKRATGWKAITPLDDSLAEMLRYWESVEDECPSRH
ncbi:MAG: GDP-mannose 4,6-dehydratase [Pseudomonadota bacterium]|nr:GDP-mannose 4,6-dehydratase [Pseudomonadota bacterium]